VSVAAEVGEDMLGARKGRLAVDDPGLQAQRGEPRCEGGGLGQGGQPASEVQGAPVEGALQPSEIPPATDLGQLPWLMWMVMRSASRSATLRARTSLTRRAPAYVVASKSRCQG
jgi:hypothetical protein